MTGFFMLATLLYAVPETPRCLDTRYLPQLTVDQLEQTPLPLTDAWQVLLDGVPISDTQLAGLAGDMALENSLAREIRNRPLWVYAGMLTAAAGTAVSSTGWALFGRGRVPEGVSLTMGLGGLALGVLGVLTVAENIRTPIEPFVAPSPAHRFSRDDAQRLVYVVNRAWQERACDGATAWQHHGPTSLDGSRKSAHHPRR